MHQRYKQLNELHDYLLRERLAYLQENKGIIPKGNWVLDYQIEEAERALNEWNDVFGGNHGTN